MKPTAPSLAQTGARARDAAKAMPRALTVPPRLVERMARFVRGDVYGAPVDPDRVALLIAVITGLR